jgi:type II secretory pathway pseudopilin PulG
MGLRDLFMKPRIQKLMRGKAGFTLVEVIVTLVITIIVIGVSSSIIISTTTIFGKTALRDMQQSVAETVISFSADQLLYASAITPVDSHDARTDESTFLLGINSDGQLVYIRAGEPVGTAPINVFGTNFYHNYSVSIVYSIEQAEGEGYSIYITATLTDNRSENEVLTRTMTRPLLNYGRGLTNGDPPPPTPSGEVLRYIIFY